MFTISCYVLAFIELSERASFDIVLYQHKYFKFIKKIRRLAVRKHLKNLIKNTRFTKNIKLKWKDKITVNITETFHARTDSTTM